MSPFAHGEMHPRIRSLTREERAAMLAMKPCAWWLTAGEHVQIGSYEHAEIISRDLGITFCRYLERRRVGTTQALDLCDDPYEGWLPHAGLFTGAA